MLKKTVLMFNEWDFDGTTDAAIVNFVGVNMGRPK